ncbi:Protein of unknown function [Gryllus bimaculatus]|nr:Protein of unknown function [Gryllus bimaculatus]
MWPKTPAAALAVVAAAALLALAADAHPAPEPDPFIKANKTPPICLPVPKVPVLKVCVQGHGFAIINNKFRLCIKLIVKLVRQTIAVITFDCLHLKLPRKG